MTDLLTPNMMEMKPLEASQESKPDHKSTTPPTSITVFHMLAGPLQEHKIHTY